ncbi:MAG: hypothetical protein ABIS36_07135 [Chryseolinea sp.]
MDDLVGGVLMAFAILEKEKIHFAHANAVFSNNFSLLAPTSIWECRPNFIVISSFQTGPGHFLRRHLWFINRGNPPVIVATVTQKINLGSRRNKKYDRFNSKASIRGY